MILRRLFQLACASLWFAVCAKGEVNLWPVYVGRTGEPPGPEKSTQYLGPLFFQQSIGPTEIQGFRPLFMTTHTGNVTDSNIIYPLFNWHREPGYSSFSFFHLIEHRSNDGGTAKPSDGFDFWPIYFSRNTGNPATSYKAFFPFGGTIRNRLSHDSISFVAWPFYMQTQKGDRRVTHTPWPIMRVYTGPGYDGFELWPLFGRNRHAGDYDHRFVLWPLFYRDKDDLSTPEPGLRLGVLPFYARSTGAGYRSETFVWPFFGYTHRTRPDTYDEQRLLWPFLVQGRGSERMVNRWAPIYTHSIVKGVDKTWYLWPLYRHQSWDDNGIHQVKDQVLFRVYWSLEQRSLTNPAAAPARKTHLWPLFSAWDNGAGSRQVQALSPFEPFFQQNTRMRRLWTPLFALYQYDRQPDAAVRHAFLWSTITYRHSPEAKEFHLGPLFDAERNATGQRWSLICGLFGFRRPAGGGWHPFLFDFHMKADNKASSAPSP